MSPQKAFHSLLVDLLLLGLRAGAPRAGYRVRREMSIVLGETQRPEPDLIVLRADAVGERSRTWYPADAVVLAVEVVSPESKDRDRERKPVLYAKAGIPYFWLVEDVDGDPVVYAYERDPERGTYGLLGIFHDRVTLKVPFEIDIDLTDIDLL